MEEILPLSTKSARSNLDEKSHRDFNEDNSYGNQKARKNISRRDNRTIDDDDDTNPKLIARNSKYDTSFKSNKRARSSSESSANTTDDRSLKPSAKMHSLLVKPARDIPSDHEEERKNIIESQRSNKQVFDRNKRMFGMLIGTLKQFKKEETGREEQATKRNHPDDILTVIEDRQPIRRDDRESSNGSVESEDEEIEQPLDRSEIKAEITNQFTNWEITHRRLCNFIRTEAKPKIFWLPKEHNSATERRLKETRDYYSLYIAEKAAKLKKELTDLDELEESNVTR